MKKKKIGAGNWLWRIGLFIWALTVLIPVLWIVNVSLKTNREFYQSVWALPEIPQFSNYIESWISMDLSQAFLNTVIYVGCSMVIRLIFTMMVSYSLTRVKFRGRKTLMWLIMLSLFLPGVNALVPTYVLMNKLHLLNSITGLTILSSVGINAFSVMVLNGFLASIPYEMEESAYMDGAGYFRTMVQIIMPMAKPGLVTVFVFSFLNLYNNFLWPFVMLGDPKKYTIAVKLYEINQLMMYKSNWVGLCSCIVIGMLPSVLFYVILQKQVKRGVTVGALKG